MPVNGLIYIYTHNSSIRLQKVRATYNRNEFYYLTHSELIINQMENV